MGHRENNVPARKWAKSAAIALNSKFPGSRYGVLEIAPGEIEPADVGSFLVYVAAPRSFQDRQGGMGG